MSMYEEPVTNQNSDEYDDGAIEVFSGELTDTPVEYKEAVTNIEYGIDVDTSTVILTGEITEGSMADFILKVRAIMKMRGEDKKDEPINVLINSIGGDIYETFGIIDFIHTLDVPVNAICRGRAMSAAALILLSVTGKRYASKYSSIMLHEISSELYGTATEMRVNMKQTEYLQNIMLEMISENTKPTYDFAYWKDKLARDYYMTSSEAKEHGIVDEILDYSMKRKFN
ncbi:hypothetical protein [Microcystis phage Mel-JY01]